VFLVTISGSHPPLAVAAVALRASPPSPPPPSEELDALPTCATAASEQTLDCDGPNKIDTLVETQLDAEPYLQRKPGFDTMTCVRSRRTTQSCALHKFKETCCELVATLQSQLRAELPEVLEVIGLARASFTERKLFTAALQDLRARGKTALPPGGSDALEEGREIRGSSRSGGSGAPALPFPPRTRGVHLAMCELWTAHSGFYSTLMKFAGEVMAKQGSWPEAGPEEGAPYSHQYGEDENFSKFVRHFDAALDQEGENTLFCAPHENFPTVVF
jgi:hypothetical protein